jgi:hypothetical protein
MLLALLSLEDGASPFGGLTVDREAAEASIAATLDQLGG